MRRLNQPRSKKIMRDLAKNIIHPSSSSERFVIHHSTRPPAPWLKHLAALIVAILFHWLAIAPIQAQEPILETVSAWFSSETDSTYSVAWGDVDGDGDLDLAVGNSGQNRIYLNQGLDDEQGNPQLSLAWSSNVTDDTRSVVWGDVDGDGDLDLAVGNSGQPNRVYLNQGLDGQGNPQLSLAWSSTEMDDTYSVAWGDVDGDDDLDLAVGNFGNYPEGEPNRVYLNQGLDGQGNPQLSLAWSSTEADFTESVAWGDVDGDGHLDLAVGNNGEPNRVYLNQGLDGQGNPQLSLAWSSNVTDDFTMSVAWGDVDGDGDLDLATGNFGDDNAGGPNRVYLNQGGRLQPSPAWSSNEWDATESVAWGDVDGDDDLDLAVGNNNEDSGGQPNRVYLNQGLDGQGNPQLSLAWSASETTNTHSVAWGDVDGDGDLDLAVGNDGQSDRLYLNQGGGLQSSAAWSSNSTGKDFTKSVAWGDVDGDGDLDLAVGNQDSNKVYLNQRGGLQSSLASWSSSETNFTNSLAWGDVDGDGDLDLAVGNGTFVRGEVNEVYLNGGLDEAGKPQLNVAWSSSETDDTRSVAWGDVDSDGDLDLAVGNWGGGGQPNRVYLNGGLDEAGKPQLNVAWSSSETDFTGSMVWGDVDSDGDLDLAVGNFGQNRVYLNQGLDEEDKPQLSLVWSSSETDETNSVAWGDVDGDGDLDLAVGNSGQNRVYLNQGGGLQPSPAWSSSETDETNSVAWGDVDGDGDLDLAVGNDSSFNVAGRPNRVYLNQGGGLLTSLASWSSSETDETNSVAWGDVDGDGDLDLAVGNDSNSSHWERVYLNRRQGERALADNAPAVGTTAPYPATADFYAGPTVLTKRTITLTYTLFDPEGDPVRFIRPFYSPTGGGQWLPAMAVAGTVTKNLSTGQTLHRAPPNGALPVLLADNTISSTLLITETETVADLDLWLTLTHTLNSDLEAVLVSPTGLTATLFSQSSLTGADLRDTVFDDEAATPLISSTPPYTGRLQPLEALGVFDGQSTAGTWTLRISDQAGGGSGTLQAWGLRLTTPPQEHVFHWQADADLIKNDNVAFRIEAYQGGSGPYQRPYASAQTFSFRVQAADWFAKVISGTSPVQGAQVYQDGQRLTKAGVPDQTDRAGLIKLNPPGPEAEPLVALAPVFEQATNRAVHDGWAYRVYHTNLNLDPNNGLLPRPDKTGEAGEQPVTVRYTDTLVLFNIVASVEWDATDAYLTILEDAFKNASAYLYDVTDGQMAFGQVTIYDKGKHWADADFQFSAKNTVRPYAFVGGITSEDKAHSIRLGRGWDRNGGDEPWDKDDGYRTMIHEFGHYALFLYDEYLGFNFNDEGEFENEIEPACTSTLVKNPQSDPATNASIMYWQYNATELADRRVWQGDCLSTEQHSANNGEADWETVLRKYSGTDWQLNAPSSRGQTVLAGPDQFPTDLLPFPHINLPSLGNGEGVEDCHVQVTSDGQEAHNALVALYTQDAAKGTTIAIDQGLTDERGEIKVLGARDGDDIRIATFDGARSGIVKVNQQSCPDLVLTPTGSRAIGAQAATNPPYFTVVPSAAGDELFLEVHQVPAGTDRLTALVIPGEGAGGFSLTDLVNRSGPGILSENFSFSGTALGTGRVRILDLSIDGDYNLQALSELTGTTLYSEDGNFELHVPAGGAWATSAHSTVIPTGNVPGTPPPGMTVAGSAYQVRISGAQTTLKKQGLVRLHYHPEVMGQFTDEDMGIFYWNADQKMWEPLPGAAFNEVDRAWSVPASRLGIYALMGIPIDAINKIYLPLIVKP